MRSTVIRYLALSIDLHGVGGYIIEPVGKRAACPCHTFRHVEKMTEGAGSGQESPST